MKKIVAMAAVMLLGTSGAWALGTIADTKIENNATLSYSAGGVQQPDVNSTIPAGQSSADEFVVDKKIDLITVTNDSSLLDVTPGQQDRIRNFKITNEGNADQNFSITAYNLTSTDPSNGQADYSTDNDTKDVNNIEFSCDGGANWYNAAHVFLIPHDTNLTCQVRADIKGPGDVVDGDVMVVELNATAVDAIGNKEVENTGADNPNNVDIVFADGESVANSSTAGNLGKTEADDNSTKGDTKGDGIDVARSGYKIQTPVLSVEKKSCVISDPVNNTNNPKRIPGAVIRYMLDIKNTGTGDVSNLNISDKLNSNFVLSGTNIDVKNPKKDENVTSCSCAGDISSKTDISGDTSVNNQDMLIQHIGVEHGSTSTTQGEKHTCAWFEVEIK